MSLFESQTINSDFRTDDLVSTRGGILITATGQSGEVQLFIKTNGKSAFIDSWPVTCNPSLNQIAITGSNEFFIQIIGVSHGDCVTASISEVNSTASSLSGPVRIDDSTPIQVTLTNPAPQITTDIEYIPNSVSGFYDQITTVFTDGVETSSSVVQTTYPASQPQPVADDFEYVRRCNTATNTTFIDAVSFDENGVQTVISSIDTGEPCREETLPILNDILSSLQSKPDQVHVRVAGDENDAIPSGLKTMVITANDSSVTIDGFPISLNQSYSERASEVDRSRATLPVPSMTGSYSWIGLLAVTEI